MPNSAKTLIVKIVSFFFFFLIFYNHGYSEEIKKVEYSNATCFETSKFSDCSFNNGKIMRGGSLSGKWSGNVYEKNKNEEPNYFYFVDDKIRYGVINYTNGKYVGDLSSEGSRYGLGTYYYKNGDIASFQNWHDEKKIGYYKPFNEKKVVGRFDKNLNLLISIPLDFDFQLKLNNMLLKANQIEIDYNEEYKNYLQLKNKLSINLSNQNYNSTQPTNTNDKYLKQNKTRSNNFFILILIILFFVFVFLYKKSSKVKKSNIDKTDIRKKFENLSYSDTKKIYSFGVKDHMSIPEACKQLRSEYFRWQTVSNDTNAFKKTLSKKNSDEIIRLRNKLKC